MTHDLSQDVATLLVRHCVKQGAEQDYEQWLRRTVATAKRYPGHLGVDVMRNRDAGQHQFTSVIRFASTAQLQGWLDSDERRQLVAQVAPLLVDGDRTEANADREFWFTPSEQGSAPVRWKQACVTFLVILPLSLGVPLLWQPLFARWPWLGGYVASNVLITLSIVLLVVYIFMPQVTRWFAPWLENKRSGA
ncbi:antibiotic biosynthesis monooxygenase [Pseudomonas guariconensis]|uniref:antibiotic biosynthesis monooxygenase n=1 Tax=Pseudomonas TaxID=286 RepID=UPI001CE40872|nr:MULTISPECIES: antibiotic biosynthesis monooxygenase [Pseudomonas]MCO7639392.1 antibiotic biosynthesis monooxygenase [Pseudomonas sp. S 311-6]MCO7515142.1 antibiotic biosynthesis monooxygenase [Pseudomonas putida]MCO7565096.1 antibiotic biosynthesis monooxygenase [Pseudomonas mosselii]MCO7593805.1 antibiotic biosynthesis monooxygenase [Pseudomonas guariconensis]MCO7605019.1 antibiotic biosynthesis monooxygenase [Pseudomonas guariconensis]